MSESFLETVRTRLEALYSVRLGQFASVGLVGAAVDNLALFALVELTVLGPVVAKVIAWELAIIVIFVINERWTFSDFGSTDVDAIGRRFLRSNVVRAGGFLVTLSVLTGLVYGFGVWYMAANVVGIGVGFFVNYSLESLYTWQVQHDER
ncbi:GtrA family protein [Halobacteria archaeon AArc-m2/3/4]|uniref:GtrA family protein n=1 Tax=Natronoglomus mannanivorans TaxID=2979990 RepID=A0ABT2QEJ8_9EURY|nr:GtrA family protein [Halobacteria archaeon AArc-m2/3/4]